MLFLGYSINILLLPINIFNQSPFTMTVKDAVVQDNRRVTVAGDELVVLTPGHVYVNSVSLTGDEDVAASDIFIVQDA